MVTVVDQVPARATAGSSSESTAAARGAGRSKGFLLDGCVTPDGSSVCKCAGKMTSKELEDSLKQHDVASALALDERDQFPVELVNRLTALGILKGLVPSEQGGALESFEQAGER